MAEKVSKEVFEKAKEILSAAYRQELADHAFGDKEVWWHDAPGIDLSDEKADDHEVGWAFAGGETGRSVEVTVGGMSVSFYDERQTRALMRCGTLVAYERNDSTGPDTFVEGQVMPGMTLEGVRKELTEG